MKFCLLRKASAGLFVFACASQEFRFVVGLISKLGNSLIRTSRITFGVSSRGEASVPPEVVSRSTLHS